MAVQVSRQALHFIMEQLESCFPDSLSMHGALRVISECETDQSQIWVDKWPDFGAILIRPPVHDSELNVPFFARERRIFAFSNQSARNLLAEVTFFDDRDWIECAATRELICPAVQESANSHDFESHLRANHLFYLPDVETLPESEDIPFGFRLDRLKSCHAALVSSAWSNHVGEVSERYMERIIRCFPTAGIYHEALDTVVAFAICYEDGQIGNLFVSPDHRRRGFASLLVSHLARKVHGVGQIPFVVIGQNNANSIFLHKKLGFVPAREKTVWVVCRKRQNEVS